MAIKQLVLYEISIKFSVEQVKTEVWCFTNVSFVIISIRFFYYVFNPTINKPYWITALYPD